MAGTGARGPRRFVRIGINESGAQSQIFTATDLLRSVLKMVDGDVMKAREALDKSAHAEKRSAARILHRNSTRKKGA